MRSPKNSLQAVLDRQLVVETLTPSAKHQEEPAAHEVRSTTSSPSRQGKRLIAGHFDPKVAKQLRLLAAEEDTSIQALLEEALDLLFVKKGKEPIVVA